MKKYVFKIFVFLSIFIFCDAVRANYWLDMSDKSIILIMTHGIGAHLPNNQKQLHLIDIKREHLIEDICVQEILPPEA